jgi:hypothetical protein
LNVIYLGANVPAQQFSNTVRNTKADLVVLVAQQLITAATLQQTALMLSSQNISVAFGGRIFTLHRNLPASISGYFLGPELDTALDEIETILTTKTKYAQPEAPSQIYIAAYQAYVSRRPQIELTIRQTLEPLSISPEEIRTSIYFLGENITAALQLGDMTHVSNEIDWLKGLLQSHSSPEGQLVRFMQTYSEAVDRNINGQGQPIYEWFTNEIEKLREF